MLVLNKMQKIHFVVYKALHSTCSTKSIARERWCQ